MQHLMGLVRLELVLVQE